MHLFLLIYFTTNIFLSKSENVINNKKLNAFNQINPLNCKNIKLPPIDDPVCVKINYKDHRRNKDIYVLAINKYEIEYAKCNPGMEATIVPIHNCDDKKKLNGKHRKKRDLSVGSGSNEKKEDIAQPVVHDNGETSSVEKEQVTKNVPLVGSFYLDIDYMNERDDYQEYQSSKLVKENGENQEDGKDREDEEDQEDGNNREDDKDHEDEEDREDEEGDKNIKYLPNDYEHDIKDPVDIDEYSKSCPTVCPFRNNFVCAKCQHNIYRSFISVCHLRSFNCKHPDEKLELIKRGPCVQASPFNNDLPIPKGKLIEPNDEDIVLKFIYCRQNGKLDKNDPRCKFDDKMTEAADAE